MLLFFGNTAQLLALALMIGGMLALGAFTAPVLFSHFARPDAGAAMLVIFRRYDIVLTVALGLLILGEGLRWAALGPPLWNVLPALVRFGVLALLVLTMGYSLFVTSPKLEALNKHPDYATHPEMKAAFQKLHKQSENAHKLGLLLAILLLIGLGWQSAIPYQPKH